MFAFAYACSLVIVMCALDMLLIKATYLLTFLGWIACRSEQSSEWTTQAADEGPLCWAVFDRSRQTQFSAAVPADAHGPARLCSQWITDTHQPGLSSFSAVLSSTTQRPSLFVHAVSCSRLQLSFFNQFTVRHLCLVKVGEWSFAFAGPKLWNSLLDSITSVSSLRVFRLILKTHLFRQSGHY